MGRKKRDDTDYGLTSLEEDILSALIGREKYGLEIVDGFKEATEGRRTLSIGSLYPTLYSLEEKGFVKSRWGTETPTERGGARRKYYKITGAGQRVLNERKLDRVNLEAWQPNSLTQLYSRLL